MGVRVRIMVFNATFNNSVAISWQSVLLVKDTGVCGENHRPAARHWQLYNIRLYRVHLAWARLELTTLVVIGTDCKGSLKSYFHTISTTTAPRIINLFTYRNTSLHVTTNETDSSQIESQYDEIDSTSYQSVTWRHYTLNDNVSVHHSSASDDKTVRHSTASDDKTLDLTPNSYEDVHEMEDEHHH
jgi:hypothetical protein